jgi:hypothetical protein
MFVIDVQADIFNIQHIRNINSRIRQRRYHIAHSNAGLHHTLHSNYFNAIVNSAQSPLRVVVSFSVCGWHFIKVRRLNKLSASHAVI